jgi:ABC-type sulfate/molybdate transport systems ATPase subunit
MAELRGALKVKAGNGKGFKVEGEDGWFNAEDIVVPYLAKIDVGTEVVVTYTQKGIKKAATKIVVASGAVTKKEAPTQATTAPSTGFVCNVCGKEMKDGRFQTCYMCNKKGLKPATSEEKPKKTSTSNTYNEDRSAQIQRGNALNAAAAVASSQTFADADTASQFTLIVAEHLLEWLRAE